MTAKASERSCQRCGGKMLRTETSVTAQERRVMGWKIGDGAPKPHATHMCRDCSYMEREKPTDELPEL